MKALTKESEKAGIQSEKTDSASVEQKTMKKKVRIVKKIVKRKIIKKVPKRAPIASDCNDLEKVASPNPNDNPPTEIQASVPVKTEQINAVVNDIREVENTKEFEVSDRENDVRLAENSDFCTNEVTASVSDDQNQIELHNSDHDMSNMDVEEHVGEDVVQEHDERTEPIDLKPSDAVEGQEIGNNETDDSKLHESSSERHVLSGETVASSSHMKPRAKIFIHGLDKQTNEEDIRKVFEEVGDVVQVKIIRNYRSGKSRGCGFIRYSSAEFAKLALKKYNNVEINGKLCTTAAVDGSDTILLNNINKNWNNEHILTLLKKIRIKNIEEVSVVPDPKNPNLNLGFAYVELETKRDAQFVYLKLQNENVFGNNVNIKATLAESSANPIEEEIHSSDNNDKNIKSVYAENIHSTWDKKSTKDNGVKVSLTKSIPKPYIRPHKSEISGYEDGKKKGESSINDELVKLLREQASWQHSGPSLTTGTNTSHQHHHQLPFEGKQPFTQMGSKLLYHEPRVYHESHFQIPNAPHFRPTTNDVGMTSLPRFDPQRTHYTSGSYNWVEATRRYFQTRDEGSYHGSSSSIYREMR